MADPSLVQKSLPPEMSGNNTRETTEVRRGWAETVSVGVGHLFIPLLFKQSSWRRGRDAETAEHTEGQQTAWAVCSSTSYHGTEPSEITCKKVH